MISFSIIGGLLALGAMLLVLPALLGRGEGRHPAAAMLSNVVIIHQQLDELDADLATGVLAPANYEQARRELEARLVEEMEPGRPRSRDAAVSPMSARKLLAPVVVTLLLAGGVASLYLRVGTPDVLGPENPAPAASAGDAQAAPHAVDPKQVVLMVTRLVERLQRDPQDADGWAMLARSYSMMQRFDDAAIAFSKAAAIRPKDPQLLVDYADTLAMLQGRHFAGKPLELIDQALQIDPDNPKALALAGTAAFDAKSYAQAAQIWQRLLARIPATSSYAASLQASIAEARQLDGLAAGTAASPVAGKAAAIRGTVSLITQLANRVSPTDIVYVFARATDSSGPPLAVVRRKASELPFDFVLDDTAAFAADMKLSKFKQVMVGAVISKSGTTPYHSGDLVSPLKLAKVDESNINILIRGIVR